MTLVLDLICFLVDHYSEVEIAGPRLKHVVSIYRMTSLGGPAR